MMKKRPKRATKAKRGKKTAAGRNRKSAHAQPALRQQVANLLASSHAHVGWKGAIGGIPEEHRGARIAGAPHTLWQLLEHMRIAQWDILEFSRDANHMSPGFPSGYWPATEAPPNRAAWDESLRRFENDLAEMKRLVLDPKTDLFARIPHGTGQTILREALLAADHNAYHLGQMVLLRRLLGAWKPE